MEFQFAISESIAIDSKMEVVLSAFQLGDDITVQSKLCKFSKWEYYSHDKSNSKIILTLRTADQMAVIKCFDQGL